MYNWEWLATAVRGVADYFGLGDVVEELGTSVIEGLSGNNESRSYATIESEINKIYNEVRKMGSDKLAELNKRLESLYSNGSLDNHSRDILNRARMKVQKQITDVEKDLEEADSKVNNAKNLASGVDMLGRFSRSKATGFNKGAAIEQAAKDKAQEGAKILEKYNNEGEQNL